MLDVTDRNGKKRYKIHDLGGTDKGAGCLGEKPFRAKQIYDWLHVKMATDLNR